MDSPMQARQDSPTLDDLVWAIEAAGYNIWADPEEPGVPILPSTQSFGKPHYIIEPTADHKYSMIILHGKGEDGEQFGMFNAGPHSALNCGPVNNDNVVASPRTLAEAMPHTRLIFPTAPLRRPARAPGFQIYQWFDFMSTKNLSWNMMLPVPGLKEMLPLIRGLLEEEAINTGSLEHVFLGGFSNGAAMALGALINMAHDQYLTSSNKLGGVFAFSGWLPFAEQLLASKGGVYAGSADGPLGAWLNANKTGVYLDYLECLKRPVLLAHGDADSQVPVARFYEAQHALRALRWRVHDLKYRNVEHIITADMMGALVDWGPEPSSTLIEWSPEPLSE